MSNYLFYSFFLLLTDDNSALTCTKDGNLVTVERHGAEFFLTVFDATEFNKVISCSVYPYPDNVPYVIRRQPCYADRSGNHLFFTDLCSNTLTCMEFAENRFKKVYSRCMDVSSVEDNGESRDGFIYMTGIRCDNSGHLLIADAKTHTLKLFTSYGQLLKCARFASGASFPYCSSFAVSSFGFLMACDRLNNRMVLYHFEEYKHGVRNELRCVQGRL